MTFNNTTIANSIDVAANARASSIPFVDEFQSRDPTTSDIQYPIQKKWLNTSTGAFWELQNFLSFNGITTANWVLIAQHNLVLETLTGNDGIVVPPTANNINVLGDVTNILTTGNAGTSTLTINLNGNVATTYVEDVGTATPSGHVLNVLGANGITTTGSGNTITIEVNGGQPITGVNVDAHTAPGTDPVLPDGSGLMTVTGGQVAAGTTTNVIRTDSLAANTYTIEIQRSQAVGSSTVGDNGVSHFNSAVFSVDSNAFVDLSTSFFQQGTWIPELQFGGLSTGITYNAQKAQFVRIGNCVFFNCYVALSNKGSATGIATVHTLPITASSFAGSNNPFMNITEVNLPANVYQTFGQVPDGTLINLLYSAGTAPGQSFQMDDTFFNNTTSFLIEGVYFASF